VLVFSWKTEREELEKILLENELRNKSGKGGCCGCKKGFFNDLILGGLYRKMDEIHEVLPWLRLNVAMIYRIVTCVLQYSQQKVQLDIQMFTENVFKQQYQASSDFYQSKAEGKQKPTNVMAQQPSAPQPSNVKAAPNTVVDVEQQAGSANKKSDLFKQSIPGQPLYRKVV